MWDGLCRGSERGGEVLLGLCGDGKVVGGGIFLDIMQVQRRKNEHEVKKRR